MDEDELLALRGEHGEVSAEAAGQYLAATDWSLIAQTTDMALTNWRRWNPEAPEVRPSVRYVIDPGHPGGAFVAVLVVVIPDDPDHPSQADWFGLWQARESGRPTRWVLLDDLWADRDSVSPVD